MVDASFYICSGPAALNPLIDAGLAGTDWESLEPACMTRKYFKPGKVLFLVGRWKRGKGKTLTLCRLLHAHVPSLHIPQTRPLRSSWRVICFSASVVFVASESWEKMMPLMGLMFSSLLPSPSFLPSLFFSFFSSCWCQANSRHLFPSSEEINFRKTKCPTVRLNQQALWGFAGLSLVLQHQRRYFLFLPTWMEGRSCSFYCGKNISIL